MLDNGMFKVPHVWQVQYMMNGNPNPNMNVFKRAALTDVGSEQLRYEHAHVLR